MILRSLLIIIATPYPPSCALAHDMHRYGFTGIHTHTHKRTHMHACDKYTYATYTLCRTHTLCHMHILTWYWHRHVYAHASYTHACTRLHVYAHHQVDGERYQCTHADHRRALPLERAWWWLILWVWSAAVCVCVFAVFLYICVRKIISNLLVRDVVLSWHVPRVSSINTILATHTRWDSL